jgi:hypothetical protein
MKYEGKVYAKINGKYIECSETIADLENPVIKKDINGKPIRKGDKFKFKFMKELHNPIELIGSFDWNKGELRYEIDIWGNDEYVCLSYVGNGIMYDFELLP